MCSRGSTTAVPDGSSAARKSATSCTDVLGQEYSGRTMNCGTVVLTAPRIDSINLSVCAVLSACEIVPSSPVRYSAFSCSSAIVGWVVGSVQRNLMACVLYGLVRRPFFNVILAPKKLTGVQHVLEREHWF